MQDYGITLNEVINEKAEQLKKVNGLINRLIEEQATLEGQITPLRLLLVKLDAERQLELEPARE